MDPCFNVISTMSTMDAPEPTLLMKVPRLEYSAKYALYSQHYPSEVPHSSSKLTHSSTSCLS
ncbi:MAG TPA: hypothetical protein VJR06_07265 [Nitrososphaerales archaeon]|nr:hypothetical protein [Nitrososphaerales archaeon]